MFKQVDPRKKGIVRWVNPESGYGVIKIRGGSDIQFNVHDRAEVGYFADHVVWCTLPSVVRVSLPRSGEEILFNLEGGERGDVITMWTVMSHYVEVVSRSIPPTRYRVMSQYSYKGVSEPDEPQVEWEGYDLDDKELKLVWNPNHESDDFSCEDYNLVKWFEYFDVTWDRCSDPRH